MVDCEARGGRASEGLLQSVGARKAATRVGASAARSPRPMQFSAAAATARGQAPASPPRRTAGPAPWARYCPPRRQLRKKGCPSACSPAPTVNRPPRPNGRAPRTWPARSRLGPAAHGSHHQPTRPSIGPHGEGRRGRCGARAFQVPRRSGADCRPPPGSVRSGDARRPGQGSFAAVRWGRMAITRAAGHALRRNIRQSHRGARQVQINAIEAEIDHVARPGAKPPAIGRRSFASAVPCVWKKA